MPKKRFNKLLKQYFTNNFPLTDNELFDSQLFCCAHLYPDLFPAMKKKQHIKLYMSNCARNLQLQSEYQKFSRILSDNHINFIPLNGIWLLDTIYPDAGLRYCEDIDILISGSSASKTKEILSKNGYTPCGHVHGGHFAVYSDTHPKIPFEIHTHLVNTDIPVFKEMFPADTETIIQCFNDFPLETRYALLLFHAAKHRFAPLKRFIDIALFVDHYHSLINREKCLTVLKKLGIRYACIAAAKNYSTFTETSDILFFYKKIDAFPPFFTYIFLIPPARIIPCILKTIIFIFQQALLK